MDTKKTNDKTYHLYLDDRECLETLLEERYIYTIRDLADIFDMTDQYIQINLVPKLDTMYLSISNKQYIKFYLSVYNNHDDVPDTIKHMRKNTHILSKRVVIKEESILKLLPQLFHKEVEGKLVKLSSQDIKSIMSRGLSSTRTLKNDFECKYDTQLYRKLSKLGHAKYVIDEPSNKKNTARYLIF